MLSHCFLLSLPYSSTALFVSTHVSLPQVFIMQSIRILQHKYSDYTANPDANKKQVKGRQSAESDERTLHNINDEEEKEKKEKEIQSKKKQSDPYYITWEGDDDPMNPQNWSKTKVCILRCELIGRPYPSHTFQETYRSVD